MSTLEIPSEDLQGALAKFESTYAVEIKRVFANKFGFKAWSDKAGEIVDAAFALLGASEIDMTIFFRNLATATSVDDFKDAFYLDGEWVTEREKFGVWFGHYSALVAKENLAANEQAERVKRMNAANPKYVLRNYLAQQAIDAAYEGDTSKISELLEVMRYPYDEQPGRESFAEKRPDWARHKAGCSMLSCSS